MNGAHNVLAKRDPVLLLENHRHGAFFGMFEYLPGAHAFVTGGRIESARAQFTPEQK